MIPTFIAEFSNMHGGDFEHAKDLIRAACDAGADVVKGQAYDNPQAIIDMGGSMPLEFYQQCMFTLDQYLELIEFGKDVGIDVFFTIVNLEDESFGNKIIPKQEFFKIPAFVCKDIDNDKDLISAMEKRIDLEKWDSDNTIISMHYVVDGLNLSKSTILYATQYCDRIHLPTYLSICHKFKKPIGVSHHGKSLADLRILNQLCKIPMIEKHFMIRPLAKYRDSLHAATVAELTELIRDLKN